MRELEEKCRAQSEQFRLLSRDLHKFRQHAGHVDLLGGSPGASADVPSTPSKPFPQLVNGIAPSIGAGECLDPSSLGPGGEGVASDPHPHQVCTAHVWEAASDPDLGRHQARLAFCSALSPGWMSQA